MWILKNKKHNYFTSDKHTWTTSLINCSCLHVTFLAQLIRKYCSGSTLSPQARHRAVQARANRVNPAIAPDRTRPRYHSHSTLMWLEGVCCWWWCPHFYFRSFLFLSASWILHCINRKHVRHFGWLLVTRAMRGSLRSLLPNMALIYHSTSFFSAKIPWNFLNLYKKNAKIAEARTL